MNQLSSDQQFKESIGKKKKNDQRTLLISGAFVSLLILLTFTMVFFLNKENPIFSQKVNIYIEVANAQNVKIGAAVQFKGIKIGTISDIEIYDLNTIRIHLGILRDYHQWIKMDSYAAIKTQGVLGDKFIEILGGSFDAKVINENEKLEFNDKSTLDQIITKSEDVMVLAGKILTKVDLLLEKIEGQKIDRIFSHIEKITLDTSRMTSQIQEAGIKESMLQFKEASMSIKKSSEHFENVTNRIEKGPGTLHSLIYDQSLHEDLRILLGGANRNKVLKFLIRESIKE